MPLGIKKELRNVLPDRDGDGVPNGFDCQPKNRRKQEAFNESDSKYLATKSEVKIGRKKGAGCAGAVHLIKDNPKMVVKVPHCIKYREDDDTVCENCFDKYRITRELDRCKAIGISDKAFLCPTKAITVDRNGHKCIGIARPLLKPINSKNGKSLTNAQLEDIRNALISLSTDGVSLQDGAQCGFTASGRLLQFDLEDAIKTDTQSAFMHNSCVWNGVLDAAGKFSHCWRAYRDMPSARRSCRNVVLDKYGRVEI